MSEPTDADREKGCPYCGGRGWFYDTDGERTSCPPCDPPSPDDPVEIARELLTNLQVQRSAPPLNAWHEDMAQIVQAITDARAAAHDRGRAEMAAEVRELVEAGQLTNSRALRALLAELPADSPPEHG